MNCEEQPWPDSGGPSNIFIPPHAVSGGKTTQTYSFEGLGLNSSQQPTSKPLPFKGVASGGCKRVRVPGDSRQAQIGLGFQTGVKGVPGGSKGPIACFWGSWSDKVAGQTGSVSRKCG